MIIVSLGDRCYVSNFVFNDRDVLINSKYSSSVNSISIYRRKIKLIYSPTFLYLCMHQLRRRRNVCSTRFICVCGYIDFLLVLSMRVYIYIEISIDDLISVVVNQVIFHNVEDFQKQKYVNNLKTL